MKKRFVTNKNIIAELRALSRAHGGILEPDVVVSAARNPKSAMHNSFDWDDTEAAQKWRIEQARKLLRVTVEYVGGKEGNPIRVFYSLTTDRRGDETGYRTTIDIMNDKELYAQLLDDALAELESFRVKYAHIKELRAIFTAIKVIRRKQAK